MISTKRMYIVEITVAGIHAKSNVKHAIKNGAYTSGLADHGADNKDNKHKHYLHYNRGVVFVFDSMGYISKSATNFINFPYSKGKASCKSGVTTSNTVRHPSSIMLFTIL